MSGKEKFRSDPTLDPSWLYQVLREEIKKEVKYDLENSAKLRAVTQGTVNYEQFRQMVLGAHIRPLERMDKVEGCQNGKRPHVVWNTAVPKPQKSTSQEKKDPLDESQVTATSGSSSSSGIFTAQKHDESQKTPQDSISLTTKTKK